MFTAIARGNRTRRGDFQGGEGIEAGHPHSVRLPCNLRFSFEKRRTIFSDRRTRLPFSIVQLAGVLRQRDEIYAGPALDRSFPRPGCGCAQREERRCRREGTVSRDNPIWVDFAEQYGADWFILRRWKWRNGGGRGRYQSLGHRGGARAVRDRDGATEFEGADYGARLAQCAGRGESEREKVRCCGAATRPFRATPSKSLSAALMMWFSSRIFSTISIRPPARR